LGDPVGELVSPVGRPVAAYFELELIKIIIEVGISPLLDLHAIKTTLTLFLHTFLPCQRTRKD